MKYLAIGCIKFYQKFISPYKGYSCSYRIRHKGDSCSTIVKNLIWEKGFFAAKPYIKHQFAQCKQAGEELRQQSKDWNNDCQAKRKKCVRFCCWGRSNNSGYCLPVICLPSSCFGFGSSSNAETTNNSPDLENSSKGNTMGTDALDSAEPTTSNAGGCFSDIFSCDGIGDFCDACDTVSDCGDCGD